MIKGDYITCDGSDSQEEVNDSLFEMKYWRIITIYRYEE